MICLMDSKIDNDINIDLDNISHIRFEIEEDQDKAHNRDRRKDINTTERFIIGSVSGDHTVLDAATNLDNEMLVVQHNYNGSYHYTMAPLEMGIRIKAELVLLQEPPTKWRIRHLGYILKWA
jgi:hypothetical protein